MCNNMFKKLCYKFSYDRWDAMASTFTVRITRELKEKMKKTQTKWSDEVRTFIEERVKHLELIETIREIELRAERRQLEVDSTGLIREDRGR